MNTEEMRQEIVTRLVDGGFTPDSSEELAFHIVLHFPEHTAHLLGIDLTLT